MPSAWTKRFTSITAALALSGVAAACSTGSDDSAAPVVQSPATTPVTEAPPATEAPVTTEAPVITEAPPATAQPTTTVEPEPEPEPEVEPVDISTFEAFALPDYAADAVGAGYSSYLVEVEPGVDVHVLEVGSGQPVYLQHGAPTSGLLYRKIAELLPPDQFRVIMPTMVGLGFSSKVPAEQHTLDNHARWMNGTLNALGLDEVIYVGHDWGGPVGMGALSRSPELLAGAVVLNTSFGAPTGPVELAPDLAAVLAPLPEDAELALSVSIFSQLAGFQNDPASFSPDVADLYRRPVAESDNPIGPLAILRMAATGPEHPTAEVLREVDAYIAQIDEPVEIVWGINDPILGDRLDEMTAHFPGAPVTETGAGHFLQEEVDAPAEIAAAIQRVRDQIEAE